MLRVAKYSLATVSLLALVATSACGSKKPPTPPSTDTVDASTSDTDMPSSSGSMGDAGSSEGGSSTASTDTPPAPASIALPTATAKAALKGKKAATVEIKSDGTVSNAGKPVAKISGMALQSADGSSTLLSVGSDGAVTAGDLNVPYGSFSGDDLTLAKGDKLSIGDDGTVTWTTGAKATPLGKFDNLGSAKKAGALAVAFVLSPPAPGKVAAPPKPGKKPKK